MKKTVLLLILILVILMTGCENIIVPQHQKSSRSPNEAVLYLGPLSEPEMGFDPILGWANVDGVSIFHSSLLTQDVNMNVIEDLAEEYSVSEDGLSYTFYLRDDAKF